MLEVSHAYGSFRKTCLSGMIRIPPDIEAVHLQSGVLEEILEKSRASAMCKRLALYTLVLCHSYTDRFNFPFLTKSVYFVDEQDHKKSTGFNS